MKSFTTQQQLFIDAVASTSGGLRLEAVAGAGKTTTLVAAANGIPRTQSALALAFNKKIAEELGSRMPPHITCSTMNSIGYQTWKSYKRVFKTEGTKLYYIASDLGFAGRGGKFQLDDLKEGVNFLRMNLILPKKYHEEAKGVFNPFTEKHLMDLEEFNTEEKADFTTAVIELYMASLDQALKTRIDFDEQIVMPIMFAPKAAWSQYNTIMVDEAQDLSLVQHEMLDILLRPGGRIIAVGDVHQAIYGWRGADMNSLDKLTERFNLATYPLTYTFRCPQAIVELAQSIVPHIESQIPGGYIDYSDTEEHDPLVVIKGHLANIDDTRVVICRNNAPLVSMAFQLLRSGVSFHYSGRDILTPIQKIITKFLPRANGLEQTNSWHQAAVEKATKAGNKYMIDKLDDQLAVLLALYEYSVSTYSDPTKDGMLKALDLLIKDDTRHAEIELSTIHKAKGKEWDTVFFLNKDLLPSPFLVKLAESGDENAQDLLVQEDNLFYVCVTRAKQRLIFIEIRKEKTKSEQEEIDYA